MLTKIEKFVTDIMEYLGMFLLVLMTMSVCFTVFTRYFLGFTPGWGEELALICMVWFGFLSMAIGVSEDLHISITILDKFITDKMLFFLNSAKHLCVGGFGWFMFSEGSRMVEIGAGNILPGIQLSSAYLYLAVPISGVSIVAYSIINFIRMFQEEKSKGLSA